MAKYLVTGGAGFIGSHIVERLVQQGHFVRVVDDLSTGKLENLRSCLADIEFIEGSVCDMNICKKGVAGVDFVLHQAAFVSVPASVDEPIRAASVNVLGTVQLLTAANEAGAQRFVNASSGSVYGDVVKTPIPEDAPKAPVSPYAASKLAQELYCLSYYRTFGLPAVVLRYFNVYGPRQASVSGYSSVIPAFTRALISGQRPIIHGDGEQSRDFVYVEDVVKANLLACEKEDAVGRCFNIGSGTTVSVKALLSSLQRLTGKFIEPVFSTSRIGDVRLAHADISLARRILGYSCDFSLEEGLSATISWFQEALHVV